jgi:UDP-N-acetylmuramate--alanine ligase
LIVFQPHLYSRTQDFASGFAESLARFNEVLLLDIYPAREEPINGVTSQWLCDKILTANKKVIPRELLAESVQKSNCRIKLLVGAGDIGAEVERVTKYIQDEG